jgi:hypothetical protein
MREQRKAFVRDIIKALLVLALLCAVCRLLFSCGSEQNEPVCCVRYPEAIRICPQTIQLSIHNSVAPEIHKLSYYTDIQNL